MRLLCRLLAIGFALLAFTDCQRATTQTTAAGGRAEALALQHKPINNRIEVGFGALRAIQVAAPFTYVGGARFILGRSADAEQHLFVIADSSALVQRLFWIQLEQLLPRDTGSYNYDADSLITVQSLPFFVNTRTYTMPPEPSSDRGRAFALLHSAGFRVPEGATRLRLVYLPEPHGRREAMVIYVEPSTAAGLTRDSLLARAARDIVFYRNE